MTEVSVIMGSKNDWRIMKDCCEILDKFNVKYEKLIVSAHRTPEYMYEFAKRCKSKVIIAGAGGAAHLPGMVASLTTIPVIGVPINATSLNGVDALHSIVQMPSGVPVACVCIDGAKNAGMLALRILSSFDEKLRVELEEHIASVRDEVMSGVLK